MAVDVSAIKKAPARAAWSMRRPPAAAILVGVIGLGCGISPFFNGFYSHSIWGVIALAGLAVLCGLVLSAQIRPNGIELWALIGLVGLAGVSLLSITWAESADNAFPGASRWVLYASTFAILVIAMRTPGAARLGLGAATLGIVVVGAYILGVMLLGDGPGLFFGGRLNDPLGYVNSQGLFLLLGVWPLIGVAQYARPVVAGLAAGAAFALTALAFFSQTRGVGLAFVVGALVVVLLVPGRLGRAWLLLLLTGSVAAISAPLLDVFELGREGSLRFEGAIHSAAGWIFLVAALVGLVWGAVVFGARRLVTPRLRQASAIVLGALILVACGVLIARAQTISDYVHDQVRAFTTLQTGVGRSRFLSGGGYRYDYWRIAAREFADHPVAGVGADNYTRDYFVERRTTEDVRQPHSLGFQTLAELGVAGTLALALFLAAIAAGAVRHVRRGLLQPPERYLLVAAVGIFSAWLAHAAVDWSHLVPGATGLGLLAAAYLVRKPGHLEEKPIRRPSRPGVSVAIRGLTCVFILLAAAIVGRSVLALHYVNEGKRVLGANPAKAIENANDALALNGDSTQALYLRSAGYARLGDYGRSRAELIRASKLEPHSFVPWALLGDLAVRRGQLTLARRYYDRAWRLNPREPTLTVLRRRPQS